MWPVYIFRGLVHYFHGGVKVAMMLKKELKVLYLNLQPTEAIVPYTVHRFSTWDLNAFLQNDTLLPRPQHLKVILHNMICFEHVSLLGFLYIVLHIWVSNIIPCFSINGAYNLAAGPGVHLLLIYTKLMFLYFKVLIWLFVLLCFCLFKFSQKLKNHLDICGEQ